MSAALSTAPSTPRVGSIRSLAPTDLDLFERHLVRLSGACRQSRFGNIVSEAFVRGYAQRVDFTNTAVLGLFVDGSIRGVAELRSLQAAWCPTAEVAFSVEGAWRRRGIATALLVRLINHAIRCGAQELVMSCHAFNVPMQRMVKRFSTTMELDGQDCVARITVRREGISHYPMADETDAAIMIDLPSEIGPTIGELDR